MNFENYSSKFSKRAISSGFSNDIISKCLSYSKTLIDKGFPVIYNTSHLSGLVGYKKSYLKRAAFHTKYFYRYFKIRKKNGEYREISEPLPSLKEIQKWILHNILYNQKVSKFAKAYVQGQTIKDHIKYHKNQKIVVTLDVSNFFESININEIESIFRDIGYSQILSNLLAKLCCLDNSLPQGAPTSPYLSNIFMKEFDSKLAKYCLEKQIRYTRYADDLAFSNDQLDTIELIQFITNQLEKIGLSLNNEKTKIFYNYQRQIISGIVVNKKAQVPKKMRNEIRNAVYYIEKYGLENHLHRINCKKSNYLPHLLGKVNYVLFINPKDEEAKRQKIILISYLKR